MIHKKILFFVIISILSSQDTVTVYSQVITNDFRKFERALIDEVVSLYNRKSKEKIIIKYSEVLGFPKLLTSLDKAISDGRRDDVLSINKISITEERKKKYDFSVPYMVNKYVVLRLNNRNDIQENDIFNKPLKVAITKNTIYEKLAKKLDTKKTLEYYFYDNNEMCSQALYNGEVDMFISDYVDTWIYNLTVAKMLMKDVNDELGIVFPKNSTLRNKLSKYISYYVKSPKFYGLIRKFFGKERMNFYKEGIHSGIH